MNVIRSLFRSNYPNVTVIRSIRRIPNRPLINPAIPSSDKPNIPALQIPLTEEELARLANRKSDDIEDQNLIKKAKEKKKTLKDRVKPEVNPPIVEPITAENQYEKLAEVVTPLYQIAYDKQLKLKDKKVKEILKALGAQLKEAKAPVGRLKNGLPCPVESVRASPEIIGFRNKDELSIYYGVDDDPKTVGFFVGKPIDPLMRCVQPTYLINMKESHKHIAKRFQSFIRQSPHDACHHFAKQGIWRNILVRSTLSDQRMATVYIHPKNLVEDEIQEIMNELREFFFHGEGADCKIDSLYLQACRHTRCTREHAPYRLISGTEYITETCEGLSLNISPDSFFQINTSAAEVLYRTIREIAEVSPLTTIVDVCCGTGSIGLVMAPHVRGVVGVEVNTGAVIDAKNNALLNKVSNAQFIRGKAEEVLPQLLPDLEKCSDVVAVINPARAGLKPEVIRSLRQCEAVSKLVYISCKPEGRAMSNFVQLASSKIHGNNKDKNPPFIPKYVIPVDMFPHTHHTELVILFERATYYS